VSKFEMCVDCHKVSPETDTAYTLMGTQFGWRLTRSKTTDGSLLLEWRCAECWAIYKRKPEATTAVGPPSKARPPPLPRPTRRPPKG
jgi:hypothetical protein